MNQGASYAPTMPTVNVVQPKHNPPVCNSMTVQHVTDTNLSQMYRHNNNGASVVRNPTHGTNHKNFTYALPQTSYNRQLPQPGNLPVVRIPLQHSISSITSSTACTQSAGVFSVAQTSSMHPHQAFSAVPSVSTHLASTTLWRLCG